MNLPIITAIVEAINGYSPFFREGRNVEIQALIGLSDCWSFTVKVDETEFGCAQGTIHATGGRWTINADSIEWVCQ